MDAGNLLAKGPGNLSVRRAFGAAYEKDGMLIIPVAMVAGGGGGGTSCARRGDPAVRPGSLPEGDATAPGATPQDSGLDVGEGSGGLVLPSGVYVVKGDQVRWVPAVDATVVVLASLSLVRCSPARGPAGAGTTASHDTRPGPTGKMAGLCCGMMAGLCCGIWAGGGGSTQTDRARAPACAGSRPYVPPSGRQNLPSGWTAPSGEEACG